VVAEEEAGSLSSRGLAGFAGFLCEVDPSEMGLLCHVVLEIGGGVLLKDVLLVFDSVQSTGSVVFVPYLREMRRTVLGGVPVVKDKKHLTRLREIGALPEGGTRVSVQFDEKQGLHIYQDFARVKEVMLEFSPTVVELSIWDNVPWECARPVLSESLMAAREVRLVFDGEMDAGIPWPLFLAVSRPLKSPGVVVLSERGDRGFLVSGGGSLPWGNEFVVRVGVGGARSGEVLLSLLELACRGARRFLVE